MTTAASAGAGGARTFPYTLTVFGEDAAGLTVLQTGTIFVVKGAGLLGVEHSYSPCAATLEDGVLHKPGSFCSAMIKEHSAYFQPGLKVYLEKIVSDPKKDKITLHLVACDECNGTTPPSYYKTSLAIQEPKGQLAEMPTEKIVEQIALMLQVDSSKATPKASTAPNQPVPPAPAPNPPAPAAEPVPPPIAPPPAPAPEPVSITAGQTVEQVVAAIGQPVKKVKVSAVKEIYVYKDLKITFVSGKVKDVD